MYPSSRSASLQPVYAMLVVLGTALPLSAFGPWLMEHGPNLPLLLAELTGSRISLFAWADVVVSAAAVLVFAFADGPLQSAQRVLVAAATLLVGVSCGLPLLLLLRARNSDELPV